MCCYSVLCTLIREENTHRKHYITQRRPPNERIYTGRHSERDTGRHKWRDKHGRGYARGGLGERGCGGTYGQTATMQHTRGDPRADTQRGLCMERVGVQYTHTRNDRGTPKRFTHGRELTTRKWATQKGFTHGEA